jgi:hypothetical protein
MREGVDSSIEVTQTLHTHEKEKHYSIPTVKTKSYHMILLLILKGKMMGEERGMSEMIKESLYIENASLRHNLIGLCLLGLFAESRNG